LFTFFEKPDKKKRRKKKDKMAVSTKAIEVSELFSVRGLIAVISGGGSGKDYGPCPDAISSHEA
jgi:hypothetical protein